LQKLEMTMNARHILTEDHIAPEAARKIAAFHTRTLDDVRAAVEHHDVVVIGMAQNPHVRRVRHALADANIPFEYLELGSYLSGWKRRLAVKLWSGWPTFPQVFVRGVLIGGDTLTRAALADGSLRARLDSSP
jgi:monothiol glutaredoxin